MYRPRSSLPEFRVCYQVKNCGTDFRWNLFGMTAKDADNLSSGLKSCRKLRALCIRNSQVDDDIFYAVYDGVRNSPKLHTIAMPNNCLTDETVPILVKFLASHPLKRVDLTNNQLTCEGAAMLAKFFSSQAANRSK